jgi:hypothetical protein
MTKLASTIVKTGLLVGTTDIIAATVSSWIRSGVFPKKIFHYIAGGALGLEKSMKGGAGTALLGLLFHYTIAFSFTVLFFLAYPRLGILRLNKYLVGFVYGWFVGAMMTFVVLPLTALPQAPFNFSKQWVGWSILGIVLGIPIAYMADKYYRNIKPGIGNPRGKIFPSSPSSEQM